MASPVKGVLEAVGPSRPPGYDFDLVFVEERVEASNAWHLRGAGLRRDGTSWWLGEDPGGSFEYWWEKEGNGYTSAVFHYYAESESAARQLVDLRIAELDGGAQPLPPMPQSKPGIPPSPVKPSVLDASDELASGDAEPPTLPHAVASALVWRLGAEMVRRHPGRLWVYPEGGGMYDRVSVLERADGEYKFLFAMNAAGAHAAFAHSDLMAWTDAFADDADPADWIHDAERRCNLTPPSSPLPPSTPSSLVPRFVAAFLTAQLGSRTTWTACSSAAVEGEHGWHRDLILDWRRANPGKDADLIFVLKQDQSVPEFGLTSSGELRRTGEKVFSLTDHHVSGGSMTALVVKLLPDLLP